MMPSGDLLRRAKRQHSQRPGRDCNLSRVSRLDAITSRLAAKLSDRKVTARRAEPSITAQLEELVQSPLDTRCRID